jgi:predicted metal-dependent hydrolase
MTMNDDPRLGAGEEFLRGIDEFNDGAWFDCHETLEELWVGAPDGLRDLYQGILQVAVALHHWQNGNYQGAMLLLASGGKLLRRVEAWCLGVDVAALIAATEGVRSALEGLGAERMGELDQALIPRIRVL